VKLAIFLLAVPLMAQTQAPSAFVAAGAGIASGQRVQGWAAYGKLLTSQTFGLPTYSVMQFQPSGTSTAVTMAVYSRIFTNDAVGLWLAASAGAGMATSVTASGSNIASTVGNFIEAGGVVGWRIPKTSLSIIYKPAATFSNVPGAAPSQHLFGVLWRIE